MFRVSYCSCHCPINWSQVLSQEWRSSWSSANRRCSNYKWVINNFIQWGVTYIRGLTVCYGWVCQLHNHCQNQWGSLAPWRCACNSQSSKRISRIDILSNFCEIFLRWLFRDFTEDWSLLVLVVTWCPQTKTHDLRHCWPSSMMPYQATRAEWGKHDGWRSMMHHIVRGNGWSFCWWKAIQWLSIHA